LEIVHDGTPIAQASVRAVAHDYKNRFAQHSVLVTQVPSVRCFKLRHALLDWAAGCADLFPALLAR